MRPFIEAIVPRADAALSRAPTSKLSPTRTRHGCFRSRARSDRAAAMPRTRAHRWGRRGDRIRERWRIRREITTAAAARLPALPLAKTRCAATGGSRLALTSARVARVWCRGRLCPKGVAVSLGRSVQFVAHLVTERQRGRRLPPRERDLCPTRLLLRRLGPEATGAPSSRFLAVAGRLHQQWSLSRVALPQPLGDQSSVTRTPAPQD
jgi:hypothetical protein